MQVKCTCNENYSTYILYGFLIKVQYSWGPIQLLYMDKRYQKSNFLGVKNKILNVYNTKCIALSAPNATKIP